MQFTYSTIILLFCKQCKFLKGLSLHAVHRSFEKYRCMYFFEHLNQFLKTKFCLKIAAGM